MAPPADLPLELEEEILCRLPPLSLARSRSVCKRWNALCDEKRFINNHLASARPQFIFLTNSNIYTIDMIGLDGDDPTIELRELASSDIPYRDLDFDHTNITYTCDGFLFCKSWFRVDGAALWNPWLRQVRWIKYEDEKFCVCGLGYDNSIPEKAYKIFGYFPRDRNQRFAIYECSSHAFKFIDTPDGDCPVGEVSGSSTSLNGNLYWVTRHRKTREYFIRSFDFASEILKPFCLLPCQKNHYSDRFVLAVFERDRFSLLKQCHVTRKIEIWVTKKKIDNGDDVVWINLMTLPTTNLPNFFSKFYGISYFIYHKTLIICCGDDETGVACIYIVRGDMFKKIQIGSGFLPCCHCVYAPNLKPVPPELRLSESQV